MPDHQFASPYFAAIDLGSNSFHMLIVRVSDTKIEIVDREKDMVQIALGIEPDSRLNQAAMDRAISSLHRFSERLRDIPQAQIRAVGTKTLRSIKNAKSFIKQAEAALGTSIQIVSGYEEARLVYAGLSNTVIDEKDNRLVIDIGGGSTEFVIGKSFEPLLLESLPLGCVTFSKNYMQTQGPTRQAMRKAYINACNELEEIRKQYISHSWVRAYGTSGTMKAIANLTSETDGGAIITKKNLFELAEYCIENRGIPDSSIASPRREVLPAGIAILQAIFDELNLEVIHVADATLKEGLIYDNIGRFSDHDIRFYTVEKLQDQYDIDRKQADRVSDLALTFWKKIEGPKLAGVSRTKILDWAAQLHEIGLNISHSSYHRHGYYILRYSDLGGFGRTEQYILANLVRFHRRKLSFSGFIEIGDEILEAFIPLLICLRLSISLNRRRENLTDIPTLKRNSNNYTLKFKEGYLDANPLTYSGLEKEIGYLKNIDINLNVET